jgi:hypothetical protein
MPEPIDETALWGAPSRNAWSGDRIREEEKSGNFKDREVTREQEDLFLKEIFFPRIYDKFMT